MSIFLEGIKKFLTMVNENWTTIIVVIGLALAIYKKAVKYFSKSDDEKIAIAKEKIEQVILKKVGDAEKDYADWVKAGAIKRSQVIGEIYAEYPILEKVADQQELVKWMDELIKDALVTLRQIIKDNTPNEDIPQD